MSFGPNDPAAQFLLDTMHDEKVSLFHRIECAKALLEISPEFRVRTVMYDGPTITIVIGGIDPGMVHGLRPTGEVERHQESTRH